MPEPMTTPRRRVEKDVDPFSRNTYKRRPDTLGIAKRVEASDYAHRYLSHLDVQNAC